MRRDYLLAILLWIAALPWAVALMSVPQYLRLSEQAAATVFWSSVALTIVLILIAIAVALRRQIEGTEERSGVTPAEIAYNVGIAATLIAWLAAIWRGRVVAISAALIATGAFAFDYVTGPPRGFIRFPWSDPMVWSAPFTIGIPVGPVQTSHRTMMLTGQNTSTRSVKLDEAYLISGVTGRRADLYVPESEKPLPVSSIDPIPAGKAIVLSVDLGPKGLSSDEFLKQWGPIIFVVKYDGEEHKYSYDRDWAVQMVTPKGS